MISNIKHAIRNRETVAIGGGEFSPAELQQFVERCEALAKALTDIKGALAGNRLVNVGNSTVHYAYHKAVGALEEYKEL